MMDKPSQEPSAQEPSRRQFLGMSVSGAIAGLVTDLTFSSPRAAFSQSKLTPDAALQELMDGNKRFVTGQSTAHVHDLEILRQKTLDKQEPFATILSCSDSRVPLELIFDQSLGYLFVIRIAGNIVTSEIMGSMEYGALVLGTKVMVVMGHARCGAVKATIDGKAVPGMIGSLFPHIQPAVDQAGPDLDASIRANAKIQADLLRTASPVLEGLIRDGNLKIASAHYDIGSGQVTLLK